jgi:hypothetical protein
MASFMITDQLIEGSVFSDRLGKTRYLNVPDGATPTPAHEVTVRAWSPRSWRRSRRRPTSTVSRRQRSCDNSNVLRMATWGDNMQNSLLFRHTGELAGSRRLLTHHTMAVFAAVSALACLEGCAAFTPVDVAKPSDITLEQATASVADSLVAMKQRLVQDKTQLGLVIDQVDVDLNIAATSNEGGSQDLKIDASKIAMAGFGATADLSATQNSTAQRTNTIHLTFKNIATAPLNCAGLAKVYKQKDTYVLFAAPPAGAGTPAAPANGTSPTGAGGGLATPTNCGLASASAK